VMLALQLNEFAEQSQRAAVLEDESNGAGHSRHARAGFTGVIVLQLEEPRTRFPGLSRGRGQSLNRAAELARLT